VIADYQAQLAAVEYGKELMGEDHDPRSYVGIKTKASRGKFTSMKKASQGGIPKNVYTIPFLIYAYGVPETTFKRWRKSARSGINRNQDNAVPEALKPGNVIEEHTVAREYYNARYFYVEKRLSEEKDKSLENSRTSTYGRKVAYGHEYDSKLAAGEHMRDYQNMAMEHDARWEYFKGDLIDGLGAYCCMSYRGLAKHVNNWCSKATIERWLKSHETYHFYTKKLSLASQKITN
jgi:hypothetical protein